MLLFCLDNRHCLSVLRPSVAVLRGRNVRFPVEMTTFMLRIRRKDARKVAKLRAHSPRSTSRHARSVPRPSARGASLGASRAYVFSRALVLRRRRARPRDPEPDEPREDPPARRAARLGPDCRVLDIACGKAGPAIVLASTFGCRIIGVERSPEFRRQHGAGRRGRPRGAGRDRRGRRAAFPLEPAPGTRPSVSALASSGTASRERSRRSPAVGRAGTSPSESRTGALAAAGGVDDLGFVSLPETVAASSGPGSRSCADRGLGRRLGPLRVAPLARARGVARGTRTIRTRPRSASGTSARDRTSAGSATCSAGRSSSVASGLGGDGEPRRRGLSSSARNRSDSSRWRPPSPRQLELGEDRDCVRSRAAAGLRYSATSHSRSSSNRVVASKTRRTTSCGDTVPFQRFSCKPERDVVAARRAVRSSRTRRRTRSRCRRRRRRAARGSAGASPPRPSRARRARTRAQATSLQGCRGRTARAARARRRDRASAACRAARLRRRASAAAGPPRRAAPRRAPRSGGELLDVLRRDRKARGGAMAAPAPEQVRARAEAAVQVERRDRAARPFPVAVGCRRSARPDG